MDIFGKQAVKEAEAKLVTATEQLTKVNTENEQLKKELETVKAEIESLKTNNVSKASYTELETKFTDATNKIAELEKNYKSAEAKALEIVAGQGVPPVTVQPEQTISKDSDLETDLKALTGKGYIKQAELEALMKKHSIKGNATANLK